MVRSDSQGPPADRALRDSEERFRMLVESVKDYAIFMLDPDGYVVSWNAGAENIKGYKAEEIIGRHFSTFYPPESIERRWPEYELRVAAAEGRFEDEGWRVRKDGTLFWANVVITALFDESHRLRGFAKITRDLTERKRIEALEEAERRSSEFLAMLSHELRNPLAPIRNALGLLQSEELGDGMREWSLGVIDRQVAHLTRLVEDLLDVSRITKGKITLQPEPVELSAIVDGAVEVCRPLIDARGHTLQIVLPAEPLRVNGDLTRLSQVVLNLLNNAAKYTPEGGTIRVLVEKDGAEVLIRVTDTGIGISADLLPQIFDLFIQGNRSLDRTEGGLGIGLTLVRRLVELHGGSVAAHSAGPGRGSEFVVRLPVLQEPPAEGLPGQHADGSTSPVGRRRVWVVDDNRDAAESLSVLLQLWGHEVHVACNAQEALQLSASQQRPDAVLLDIGLPGMDGYELAKQLRGLPDWQRVLLVAVTGYGQGEDRRRSREAGFAHHLVKPVEPAKLHSLLASSFTSPLS
ncbi:MAG TPA: ATP-binding protein [Thermoanaerobaculia bacterium]|jgi:PAS domain S-box-containing protein|nr:ATP-binding protein [Thermoanaerobaculia bacterium]